MKTKKDIEELMHKIFQDLQVTREAGQKEYAHDSENAFGNFERLAVALKISREQILWVYVQKHLDGIVSWINGHKSQREDVRGRIKDVMVYLVLLWGMVDDSENVDKVVRDPFKTEAVPVVPIMFSQKDIQYARTVLVNSGYEVNLKDYSKHP